MSNPNDPYDPNRAQESWGAPDGQEQMPSNDWNAPQQQQHYGQQNPGGPMMPPHGQPGMSSAGAALEQNDILAIVLSALFPGAGQIVLGQTTKGIVWLIVSIFTCSLGGLLNVAAAIDAYAVANAKKKRAVGEWEFFPDLTNK